MENVCIVSKQENIIVISDSSDSDFEGFLEGSFDIEVVERQHDTVNRDSDISLDEDVSNGAGHDEKDMFHAKFKRNHKKICIQKKYCDFSYVYPRHEILYAFYDILICLINMLHVSATY